MTINGKTPKPSTKLKAGDSIVVALPPPPGNDVDGEDIPLSILYEDNQVRPCQCTLCKIRNRHSLSAWWGSTRSAVHHVVRHLEPPSPSPES